MTTLPGDPRLPARDALGRVATRASGGTGFAHMSPVALLAGYAVLYCLLDWISFVQPMGLITAWNPQWALAVAMFTRVPRMRWAVAVSLVAAAVQPALRHSSTAELVASSVEVFGDVGMALAMRHWLGHLPSLETRRDYAIFMAIVAVGAAVQTALYAAVLAVGGTSSVPTITNALVSGWVGAVNLVVALPLILALSSGPRRREIVAMLGTTEWWLIALLATAISYTVFVRSAEDQFKHFYLLFLPVGWASARFGTAGAVGAATLVQVLLVVAAQSLQYEPRTVFELHMLLVALGAAGLLIGAILSERHRADEALRASLHAAAAADMAAALAHELNQPLTSLVSYAQAARLLARRMEGTGSPESAPLVDVSEKLVKEAMRAGETVRRLRDFFRQRGTQLQPTDMGGLVDEAVRTHASRATAAGIVLDWAPLRPLPLVMVDPIQIEVVLRNLIANALEAASQEGGAGPFVRVEVVVRAADLVVQVSDSGPGIPADETSAILENRKTSKPGGMGIGLAISKSIVEAHEGRLWAEPGPGGRFFFSLPLANAADAEGDGEVDVDVDVGVDVDR
jgi:signal transduction histidine kinase